MKFRLVKLTKLSGTAATIYSIIYGDDSISLYEKFIKENSTLLKSELFNINIRLKGIGNHTGAREIFFTPGEGNLGDGVCAFFDLPNKKLRLYCIRYGTTLLIVGGGGIKPKPMRKLQESKKLTLENAILRDISNVIKESKDEIRFSSDYFSFVGKLEFDTEDYED